MGDRRTAHQQSDHTGQRPSAPRACPVWPPDRLQLELEVDQVGEFDFETGARRPLSRK